MRIVRYRRGSDICYGIIEGSLVSELRGYVFTPLEEKPCNLSQGEGKNNFRRGLKPHTDFLKGFTQYEFTEKKYPMEELEILAPCQPTKIVALGLNYRSHAEELKMKLPEEPLLFLKPSTSVIGPNKNIVYPAMSHQIDYEAELGVVIGRETKSISEDKAKEYILGYTCFNDVTARDLQGKDKQFTRSKGFDTFAPMGPWIETQLDPYNLKVESYLNGELKQSGTTADMVFSVFHLVSFISKVMTLLPGDVIATGTPAGIGPMKVGDTIEIVVEGIGTLKNEVS
jgi:2-keto-4-pentenoate hydratase/2-oxohepta-3-ene-1,7-dioic acid hydratase in catechol pathway